MRDKKIWIIPAAVVVAAVIIAAVLMIAQSPSTAASAITAGGSTFAAPQWQHWASLYYRKTGITVNYQSVGSGAGQDQFEKKTFAFGGTDIPLKKDRYDRLVEQYGERSFIQCPVMLGSLVIAYHVPEIAYSETRTPLRLTSDLVAMLFTGEIKYWDDPRIKKLNPKLADRLPHKPIVRVVRADQSGTTGVFTVYLNNSSLFWQRHVNEWGLDVKWPNQTAGFTRGKGNEGVSAGVLQTPYSVGYIEYNYWYVNAEKYASIGGVAMLEGADEKFYYPNETSILMGVESALEAVKEKFGDYPSAYDDWNPVSLAFIFPPSGYPIVSFSYFTAWTNYTKVGLSPSEGAAVKEFLTFALTEGQKPENMLPGYLPIPKKLAEICLSYVEQIS